jgi:hypothetical protein
MSTAGKYMRCRIRGIKGVSDPLTAGVGPLSPGQNGTGNPPGYVVKGMQRWTVAVRPDDLDATDAEHDGFTNSDIGAFTAEVTIDFVHRNANGPFPAFLPGAILNGLELYANSYKSQVGYVPDWQFPWCVVMDMTHPVEVRGQTRSTIRIKNKGPFRGPGQPKWTAAELITLALPQNSPDA